MLQVAFYNAGRHGPYHIIFATEVIRLLQEVVHNFIKIWKGVVDPGKKEQSIRLLGWPE